MSQTTENKRQEQIKETQSELKRKDVLNANRELRSTVDLAKISPLAQELEEAKRNEAARVLQEQVGDLDELQRMKLDYDYKRMADFLGLQDRDIDDSKNALQLLMEWAKEKTRNKDIVSVLSHLKKVQKELGFREVGLTGVRKLYQYARLDIDATRIQREKELLKEK